MAEDLRRMRAITAALKSIRDHVAADEDTDTWATAAFNDWIDVLDDVSEMNVSILSIAEDELPRADFLMRLKSCVAFLEELLADDASRAAK